VASQAKPPRPAAGRLAFLGGGKATLKIKSVGQHGLKDGQYASLLPTGGAIILGRRLSLQESVIVEVIGVLIGIIGKHEAEICTLNLSKAGGESAC